MAKKSEVSCDVYMFRKEGDVTPEGRQFPGKRPVYKTKEAAGADVCVPFSTKIPAREAVKIPLRIGFDIPKGYCVMMYPRSSLLFRGLLAPTTIIDQDFSRNEVHCPLLNVTDKDIVLEPGERVAQVRLVPCVDVPEWDHEDNARDPKGFGGSGRV